MAKLYANAGHYGSYNKNVFILLSNATLIILEAILITFVFAIMVFIGKIKID